MVVLFTVCLPVPLVEVLGSQGEVTVSTGKVLNMPHLSQGRDHLSNNGLVTGPTHTLSLSGDPLTLHVLV